MIKKEIMQKISQVKKRKSNHEIFIQQRPPEEFGDAIELFFNDEKQKFHAIVFDPNTDEVFSEEELANEDETYTFITDTLEPKLENENNHKDYIDLDVGEPER